MNEEKSNAIHNHIGYLYANNKIANVYDKFRIIPLFLKNGVNGIDMFEANHIFARFEEKTAGIYQRKESE